ncbi:P-loop containing nucleoside triphosphate hydrolase protein [Xylaria telfairii]|nr:P-loop containing nucleoside triphosphate hydrolase protein [Xylaria telfairii]
MARRGLGFDDGDLGHTLPISSIPPTPSGSRSHTPDGRRDGKDEDDSEGDHLDHVPSSATSVSGSEQDSDHDDWQVGHKLDKVTAELDTLVGLEAVKDYFRELGLYIDNSKIVGVDFVHERFHAIFQGNPGTGKTTVARLYADFLYSKRVLKSGNVLETSGGKLASHGPNAVINNFSSGDGGVLFVDEAYQLVAPHSGYSGKQVLDVILTEMENRAQRWVVIFAGYKNEFEPFFAHNEGLASRIPRLLDFDDFTDDQLYAIMLSQFKKRFPRGGYKVEGQPRGVYIRAAIRRISQGRGRRGFGNARAVQNYFQRICQRQASRIGKLKNPSMKQRLYFTKEDILGPRPINVKANSKAWAKLKSLIGLSEVKRSVNIMFQIIDTNYQRELEDKRPHAHSLNRVFVGSPGTGKTTVAKLYGKILADLGFLSKGDVVVKTPADFIGDAVGRSESNTKAILASTIGKVLIIDEAYMLDPGDATNTRDSYKTAVLDSIVAEVQGNPGDDRCVILLGYEDKMESLFQNGNPGLSGRFMADMPFRFADYNNDELRQILEQDLKDRHIKYQPEALNSAIDMLSRYRNTQNFSNARAVKTLVSEAVLRNQERQMKNNPDNQEFDGCLEPQDFDPWLSEWAASSETPVNCRAALSGQISDSVIEQLEKFLPGSQVPGQMSRDKLRQNIPRTFVFTGPPGTGKTTLAMYMGRLFRDLGLLPTDQVVKCPAVAFIGQHVGHTFLKTRAQLERGLGKVLVIQDLHRLSKGGFSSEALDELSAFLRIYSGRMAVILTGPKEPLDDLLRERPELSTSFQDRITFNNLSPRECLTLLDQQIHVIEPGGETPFSASDAARGKFQKAMAILTLFESWGNSRDVAYLASSMIRAADNELYQLRFREPGRKHEWVLTETMAMACFKARFHDMKRAGGALAKIAVEDTSHGSSGGDASDPSAETTNPEEKASEAAMEATAVSEQREHATTHETVQSQQELAAPREAVPPQEAANPQEAAAAAQVTIESEDSRETKSVFQKSVHASVQKREEMQQQDTREQESEKENESEDEQEEKEMRRTDDPCPNCGRHHSF